MFIVTEYAALMLNIIPVIVVVIPLVNNSFWNS